MHDAFTQCFLVDMYLLTPLYSFTESTPKETRMAMVSILGPKMKHITNNKVNTILTMFYRSKLGNGFPNLDYQKKKNNQRLQGFGQFFLSRLTFPHV